ncbi:MAG: hypothetical protein JO170_33340 [Verrucomicrobia bacterium]|nr:hypothetical protein [Verrucomicrobiota bacterium]
MPSTKTEKATLEPEDAREMKRLTSELSELFKKIAQIVLPRAGVKDTQYSLVTVVLRSADNPLQIAFRNSRILDVREAPIRAEADEIGYYLDPPGICTTVPACVPE